MRAFGESVFHLPRYACNSLCLHHIYLRPTQAHRCTIDPMMPTDRAYYAGIKIGDSRSRVLQTRHGRKHVEFRLRGNTRPDRGIVERTGRRIRAIRPIRESRTAIPGAKSALLRGREKIK